MYWITAIWPFAKISKNFFLYGSRSKKQIALTFDDSPSRQTDNILEILSKHNSKATFFVIGRRIRENSKVLDKIIKQGSEIGNHSYNHEILSFKSKEFIRKEIDKTDKLLSKYRIKTSIFRPPSGSFGFNLISVINEKNMKSILWDMDPKDWKCNYDVKERAKYILKRIKNGSIIDLHDYAIGVGENNKLVDLLKIIIPELKERGYKLVTISELFSFNERR